MGDFRHRGKIMYMKGTRLPVHPAVTGIRRSLPGVIPGLLITVLFLSSMALPVPVRAEFRIIHAGGDVMTQCYWIERSFVYLCEGGEPVRLSEVSAIEHGAMTALDAEMRRDALRRWFVSLTWLQDRQAWLMDQDALLAEDLKALDTLRMQPDKDKELKTLKNRLLDDMEDLQGQVMSLDRTTRAIRIPDRCLVHLVEIKTLQMLSWLLALRERQLYLESGDPTHREYALEHMLQEARFGDSFRMHLEKAVSCGMSESSG